MSKQVRLDEDLIELIQKFGKKGERPSDVLRRILNNACSLSGKCKLKCKNKKPKLEEIDKDYKDIFFNYIFDVEETK